MLSDLFHQCNKVESSTNEDYIHKRRNIKKTILIDNSRVSLHTHEWLAAESARDYTISKPIYQTSAMV